MRVDPRMILAVILFAHGIAHLVGFAVPWGLMDRDRATVTGLLFNGRVRVGDRAQRAIGIVWLALAIAFIVAAGGVAGAEPRWISFATAVTIGSAAMCLVGWPAARIGFALDIAILIALTAGTSLGWI